MRAVHLQDTPDWIRDVFGQELQKAGVDVVWAGSEDAASLPEIVAGAEVLLTGRRHIGVDLIRTPGLKLIQVQGRAPWAVDWSSAAEAGVPVSVLPHRGAIAVAEQAITLMLGLHRLVVSGHEGTRTGAYAEGGVEPVVTSERRIAFNWLKFDGIRQLYGQTVGLVGLGDIALEVARRAHAFDMTVLYHKRARLPSEFEAMAGVRYASLDELLAESDVVSLHAPHTERTERMIDAKALSTMKADAILINTARGGLIDEGALVRALSEGHIGGAGLDAFVEEPLPVGHPLTECPNVLFSPHIGGGTGGGQRGMIGDVVENLRRLSEGASLTGLVQP